MIKFSIIYRKFYLIAEFASTSISTSNQDKVYKLLKGAPQI